MTDLIIQKNRRKFQNAMKPRYDLDKIKFATDVPTFERAVNLYESGKVGKISKAELSVVKKSITEAMRYIKSYNGPSRIWFSYQNSLNEGCARLSVVVSNLPVCEESSRTIVDILLRLNRKLLGGVDDSDGTVGGFIEETVLVLKEFVKLDPECARAFEKLKRKETNFGWEEFLVIPKVQL